MLCSVCGVTGNFLVATRLLVKRKGRSGNVESGNVDIWECRCTEHINQVMCDESFVIRNDW